MIADWQVAVALTLITQVGLIFAAWQQRRRTKMDKAASVVSILHDVNEELRIELNRMINDLSRLTTEINELRDQLRLAKEESRRAHETAGRCMRKVDYLERILQSHGIKYESTPID